MYEDNLYIEKSFLRFQLFFQTTYSLKRSRKNFSFPKRAPNKHMHSYE